MFPVPFPNLVKESADNWIYLSFSSLAILRTAEPPESYKCNIDVGAFVPIPTLPVGSILILSVLDVSKVKGSAVTCLNLNGVFPVPFPYLVKESADNWICLSFSSLAILRTAPPPESYKCNIEVGAFVPIPILLFPPSTNNIFSFPSDLTRKSLSAPASLKTKSPPSNVNFPALCVSVTSPSAKLITPPEPK